MCCIGGADADIVFLCERLEKAISVEGIHGTPEDSKVRLDGYGSICLCGVYVPVYISDHLPQNIVSDGVLTEAGFKVRKEKGGFNFSRRVVYTHGLICTSTSMAELISERI